MIAPPPQRRGHPPGRSVVVGLLIAGLGLAFILSVLPAPQPATLVTQVVVIHDSLTPPITYRPDPTRPAVPPELQATVTSTLDGSQVDSWLYRAGLDRVSVHRVHGSAELPRNAVKLVIADQPGPAFEVDDLSLLSWSDAGHTWRVAGDAPVHRLREVAAWVRTKG